MVILELSGDGRSDALVLLERTEQGVRGAVRKPTSKSWGAGKVLVVETQEP